MRVLIADGDEVLLELLQSYVQRRGHDVETAAHGLDCIATLFDFAPDVVVLDQDLLWGGCEGILSLMHDHPELSEIPVILMSDAKMQLDERTSTNVVAWLQKPFQLSSLLEQISSAIHILNYAVASSRPNSKASWNNEQDGKQALLLRSLGLPRMRMMYQRFPDRPNYPR